MVCFKWEQRTRDDRLYPQGIGGEMKMKLEEIMRIRHSGSYQQNGGIFFDCSKGKFFKVNDVLGKNWIGSDKGKPLPVEQWEEIEVTEQ